jgi:hypothetical protein
MLTHKLIHLIQYHSENLAASLVRQVQMSDRAGSYRNVSPEELKQRVFEIYRHVGEWLLNKSEADIEDRYRAIGARRVEQNVSLSELVWVIVLTKRNLWMYINDVSVPGRTADVSEKQEIQARLEQFFDEAIHAAVAGSEFAAQTRVAATGRRQRDPGAKGQLVA